MKDLGNVLLVNSYCLDENKQELAKGGCCYFKDGKINYKKSIKFWSRVRSRCKKELKKLRDRGITGEGNLCRLTPEQYTTWANYHNQYLNAEDMMHQVRYYRKDKYGTHYIQVTTDLSK